MEALSGRVSCNCLLSRSAVSLPSTRRRRTARVCRAELISSSSTGAPVKEIGICSLLGTSREANEDRYDYQFVADAAEVGEINTYVGIFDGHGGITVSERLEATFRDQVTRFWNGENPESTIKKAFIDMDRQLLQCPPGFFGMFGERGIGGSRCGATAATAFIFKDKNGVQKLLAANVGDSRVVLIRDRNAVQLTEDHVPDLEAERKRIERENPNPRMPLVRFVGGTWRVGGILALSRAFGDAYMKANLEFEGVDAGSDYSTGFGVIAEPYISLTDLKKGDTWLMVHTDGLNNTEIRGGGGGLTNEQLAAFTEDEEQSAQSLAEKLAEEAQKAGSTDDVSIVCIKLNT